MTHWTRIQASSSLSVKILDGQPCRTLNQRATLTPSTARFGSRSNPGATKSLGFEEVLSHRALSTCKRTKAVYTLVTSGHVSDVGVKMQHWACSICACGEPPAQWRHFAPGLKMGEVSHFGSLGELQA